MYARVDKVEGIIPSIDVHTVGGTFNIDTSQACCLIEDLTRCVREITEIQKNHDGSPLKRRRDTWRQLSDPQKWHLKRRGRTQDEIDCMDIDDVKALLAVYVPEYYEEKEKRRQQEQVEE